MMNCSEFPGSFYVYIIGENGVPKILLENFPILIKFAK